MSDHHQHGALIARPPKTSAPSGASTQSKEPIPSPGAKKAVHGAAPFSGRSTPLGKMLSWIFAERPSK